MGQRLNLEIRKKGKILANSYYHWSAYTPDSFRLINIAYDYITMNHHKENDDVMLAVHALESTGAGMEDCELTEVYKQRKYAGVEFKKATDRNEGLLAISEKGIESTIQWSEETAVIDITDPEDIKFNFWVVWADDEDYYIENDKNESDIIVDYAFDPEEDITYTQLCEYVKDLTDGKVVRYSGRVFREIA